MTMVGDPLGSRHDASGRFNNAALSVEVSRAFDRFTVRGVATAQYSDRPLLSAEEFSLGGNRVGRAFDFNERTGDRGAGAGVEVGYRLGKNAKGAGVELLGFLDGGITRDLQSSVAAARTRSLSSAGVGARFSIAGMTFGLEAGVPLSGDRHKPRLFGSVFRAF
jgi:hemolysin activation/secretion protein